MMILDDEPVAPKAVVAPKHKEHKAKPKPPKTIQKIEECIIKILKV